MPAPAVVEAPRDARAAGDPEAQEDPAPQPSPSVSPSPSPSPSPSVGPELQLPPTVLTSATPTQPIAVEQGAVEPVAAEPGPAEPGPAERVRPERVAAEPVPAEPSPETPPEPSLAESSDAAPSDAAPPGRGQAEPVAEEHCTQCGGLLAPSDIFCGECGFVRPSVARRHASDTNVLDPFPWGIPRQPQRATEAAVAVTAEAPASAVPGEPPAPTASQASPPSAPQQIAAANPTSPPIAPEPAPHGDPLDPPPLVSPSSPAGHRPVAPDLDDVDETRIVDRTARGERFVLQFSTGESVSVFGTGLVGRNPIPEPGEYFDAIVAIIDPGKSVSKTHLEFGQEGGAFWISDRFSGNGTVLREPERAPRRADPGKRYRLVRGSRVDIGEQFFIVS